MDKEFNKRLIADRALALAFVLLTRRDDLDVKETKEGNDLDYTVDIKTAEDVGKRPFGVYVAATMSPVTLEAANKQLKTELAGLQTVGPFPFPVCVFFFTVKDDQGYYAWASEPVVTEAGQPRLRGRTEADCRRLGNEALEEIVSAVSRWYDAFYATITATASQGE
jgi:hypothetical protein